MKLEGYLFAALSAISYGTIPLFALPLKRVGLSFDTVLTYRFLFTALLIGLYLLWKKEKLNVNIKELLTLVTLGLLFAFSSYFLFWSYDFMDVGIASTLLFMYPVFVAMIMTLVFKEKASWTLWVSIALAFFGIYMINGGSLDGSLSLFGIMVVGASALSYGLYIVVINKSPVKSMSGVKLTFYSMLISGIFFLTKSLMMTGELQHIPNLESWANILLFAVVSTAISCIAMVYAVHHVGSTVTAVMGALEPVVAVIIGVMVFHEQLTLNLVAGLIFILTAVIFIVQGDHIISKTKQVKGHWSLYLLNIKKRNRTNL